MKRFIRTCPRTNRGPEIVKVVSITRESTRQPRYGNGVIVVILHMNMIFVRVQHIQQSFYQARILGSMVAMKEEIYRENMTIYHQTSNFVYVSHYYQVTDCYI